MKKENYEMQSKLAKRVNELKNYQGGRRAKYYRNFRKYTNSPTADLSNLRDPAVIGLYQFDGGLEEDTSVTPSLNVIKSCIDTLTSKIAQSKVRPFFNCINGTWKDIYICKQAQQYFDVFFDFDNIYKVVSEAFRDSAIFETGYVYIDGDEKRVSRALPWQVYFRPSETTYNKYTRVYYERKDYPVALLPNELRKLVEDATSNEYCSFGIYFDKTLKIKAYYIDVLNYFLTEQYESDILPIIPIYYNCPVFGNSSLSVVDMLNSIQDEINSLMTKIKDASQLNSAMTYFVPEGSTIKVGKLSNRVGNVVTYKPLPNSTGVPVISSTPPFIDNQYISTVDNLVSKAYEMVGISQLSAQSKKPTGLDSGVALATMEDSESDRFETQLNQVIRCYVDIAKACIDNFNKDEDILPESQARAACKWKDIVNESKKMSIQYSAADALSKDPSTKLKMLKELAEAGAIPRERIFQFMELPDLEAGYSLSNNAINAVMSIIEACLDDDDYEVPTYIPFTLLEQEILNTQLSLRGANYKKNKDDIAKLTKLFAIVENEKTKFTDATVQSTGDTTEGGLPTGGNILDSEINSQDLDMTTSDSKNTSGWDRRTYSQSNEQNNNADLSAENNSNI